LANYSSEPALNEDEIARRRDEAIRRALNTPPQPRPKPQKGKRGRPKKTSHDADQKPT